MRSGRHFFIPITLFFQGFLMFHWVSLTPLDVQIQTSLSVAQKTRNVPNNVCEEIEIKKF
ncbi:protein of unknown function [Enterobacter cancerogenus]|nr:protein of unknown function [Enterobacter cancerogenus]